MKLLRNFQALSAKSVDDETHHLLTCYASPQVKRYEDFYSKADLLANDHFTPKFAQIIISCIMFMLNMIFDCKSDCNAPWAQKWILTFKPDLSGNCIFL